MNIFVLDTHPKIAAEYHCDKHVVKMVTESAQILSSAHSYYGSAVKNQYKDTHYNNPCIVWARSNDKNYLWLWCLFYWLSIEYEKRYKRVHKTANDLLRPLLSTPKGMPVASSTTPFYLAMPEIYRSIDSVESYRRYYIAEKYRFARWAYTPSPPWWPDLSDLSIFYALNRKEL
jgi:hypothetical protein